MKNLKLAERKQQLKELAEFIKKNKPCHSSSESFRFKHLAYCMARGRKYEEIEQKTRDNKVISEWQWTRINKDIDELKAGFHEEA